MHERAASRRTRISWGAKLSDRALLGRSVLIAEDDYFWADELRCGARSAGANVLGPFATVGDALKLVESAAVVDGAILNIDLRGEHAYAVADRLIEQAVPVLIVTGYDEAALPVRYAGVRRLEKPVGIEAVIMAMRSLLTRS
ncbi:response regulator receiver protein [Methylorubrum populi]|uniref:Response regulator receiver protein n=1 Tax=Methylorubrum populi TaxID=223967 RepID=A0A160PEX8_9HYPH|nr:response regulator receiver protein [Methylorubrum populi]